MQNEWIKTFKTALSAPADNVEINSLVDKLALSELKASMPITKARPVFFWDTRATGLLMKQFR